MVGERTGEMENAGQTAREKGGVSTLSKYGISGIVHPGKCYRESFNDAWD